MKDTLHKHQITLLNFLKGVEDLEGYSYWDIARELGLNNAQTVKHHLLQLEKLGYVRKDMSNPSVFEVLKNPVKSLVYLNLFGFAQCGSQSDFFSSENIKEKVAISTKILGISRPEDTFIVQARGDSMMPEINNNDLVIIQRQSDVDTTNVALVIHNDLPMIKVVIKDGKKIILRSWNKKHSDIVTDKKSIEILGLAKRMIKSL